MDLLLKPIEVVASFSKDGVLFPLRIRLIGEDGAYHTIFIRGVEARTRSQQGLSFVDSYRCQGEVQGALRFLELRHRLDTGSWILQRL
ncbi:hypothetical protein ABB02_00400 [Clostridiaceae bacterium JG1575]|nr:hypothetical protein ABB02_00400 [Clostridiaceae bacterium JG1575]